MKKQTLENGILLGGTLVTGILVGTLLFKGYEYSKSFRVKNPIALLAKESSDNGTFSRRIQRDGTVIYSSNMVPSRVYGSRISKIYVDSNHDGYPELSISIQEDGHGWLARDYFIEGDNRFGWDLKREPSIRAF